jgi:hypothetical protein
MAKNEESTPDDVTVLSASETAELATLNAFFPGITDTDPNAVRERMAGRMRGATTLDELFDALSGSNSKSLVGKTFEFQEVAWQGYKAERGMIPLAVCTVVNVVTGEEEEFITTGDMMVEFLRQAQLLKLYPFKARIDEKVTRSGQKALNLVRA